MLSHLKKNRIITRPFTCIALLEQNLLWIVEPYSVVELECVVQQVGQERQAVEAKYFSTHPTTVIEAMLHDKKTKMADCRR
jgi:hypothetical protein